MFAIIGILVVLGGVIGGYLMEGGKIMVLVQPAELIIIGGAALGTLLIANPVHILKEIVAGLVGAFKGSPFTTQRYLDTLKMLYELFNRARREGLAAVEGDVEEPEKSKIFGAYPHLIKDHHVMNFICDTLRTATSGAVDPFDLDQMMEVDMDVHHHNSSQPISSLTTVADALPGLGIVAAVLGICITMGAIGGPPEEMGHKVAAALVGTFLGILMCYGFVGPLSSAMGKTADDENAYYQVIRVCIAAFIKGTSPILAVEMGRRAIPNHVRPNFADAEKVIRNKGGAATPAPAPPAAAA
jgi:chemotaxis protein MotA